MPPLLPSPPRRLPSSPPPTPYLHMPRSDHLLGTARAQAWLADRIGRRLLTSLACAVLCLMHFACTFDAARSSPSFLSAFSFCLGAFNGMVLSTCPAVPAELMPPSFRGLASSAILSPIGVGFLIGPPVGSAMQVASGSYASAMAFASGCLGLCSVLMWLVSRMPADAVGTGGLPAVTTSEVVVEAS